MEADVDAELKYLNRIKSDITVTEDDSGDGTLEHVEVTVDITHDYPNELEIVLVSPSGTRSILAWTHQAGVVLNLKNLLTGLVYSMSKLI